jgi:cell division protein ZapA
MNDKLEPNLIQIEIFGQVYKVRGEEDQGYIEELARYVDSKMKAIAESSGAIDSLKVAVLAALNIADEFFKQERHMKDSEERVAARADELAQALDEALKDDEKTATPEVAPS